MGKRHSWRQRALAVGVLALGLVGATWAGQGGAPAEHKDADQQLSVVLRDVINRGREYYNNGNPAACYFMFHGSLQVAIPSLEHRPELQKAVRDGLAEAEANPDMRQRAWMLRTVLDKVRTGLKSEARAGAPKVEEKKPAPEPAEKKPVLEEKKPAPEPAEKKPVPGEKIPPPEPVEKKPVPEEKKPAPEPAEKKAAEADTQDSLLKGLIGSLKNGVAILKTVQNEDTAKAALPKVKKISDELADLKKRMDKLGKPTEEQEKELVKKYGAEMTETFKGFADEMERLSKVAGAEEILKLFEEKK